MMVKELIDVLSDEGTWVFAIGAASIAGTLCYLFGRLLPQSPLKARILICGCAPCMLLIGTLGMGLSQRSDSHTIQFWLKPDVHFGLAIWLAAGIFGAWLVTRRGQDGRAIDVTETFE